MTDAQDRQDEARPRKGGFGAFSEQYRERWAVDHPKPKPAPLTKPRAVKPSARSIDSSESRTASSSSMMKTECSITRPPARFRG